MIKGRRKAAARQNMPIKARRIPITIGGKTKKSLLGKLSGKGFLFIRTKAESRNERIQRRMKAAKGLYGMWEDKDVSFFDK